MILHLGMITCSMCHLMCLTAALYRAVRLLGLAVGWQGMVSRGTTCTPFVSTLTSRHASPPLASWHEHVLNCNLSVWQQLSIRQPGLSVGPRGITSPPLSAHEPSVKSCRSSFWPGARAESHSFISLIATGFGCGPEGHDVSLFLSAREHPVVSPTNLASKRCYMLNVSLCLRDATTGGHLQGKRN
jgi:hypothetical protein